MPNFGLPLLLNRRLIGKTSYLKIKGLCGTIIFNLQKQGDTAANRSVVEQRADHGNKSRDTPFSTPFYLYIFENIYLKIDNQF